MEEIKADLVVIGSGPAGQKAAIQAAKLGKKVVVIEKEPFPGGACLYSGTIPSKTLREAIVNLTDFNNRNFYGQDHPIHEVTIQDLNFRLHKVIEEEKNMVIRQFKKNNIQLVTGTARFENAHQLIVMDDEFRIRYQIVGSFIIIATGSKPRRPIDVPFDGQVIVDSSTLLALNKVPKTMVVLGGRYNRFRICKLFCSVGNAGYDC